MKKTLKGILIGTVVGAGIVVLVKKLVSGMNVVFIHEHDDEDEDGCWCDGDTGCHCCCHEHRCCNDDEAVATSEEDVAGKTVSE